MRDITAAVESAVEAEHVPMLAFVEMQFASATVRVCSAFESVPWNGFTWLGLGNLGSIEPIEESNELQMNGIGLQLSGVNPALISTALGEQYQGRRVNIWFAPLGDQAIESGTAQAGSSTTLTLRAAASAVDGAYHGRRVRLTDGSSRERRCINYVGATKVATVSPRWRTNLIGHTDFSSGWGGIVLSGTVADGPDGPGGAVGRRLTWTSLAYPRGAYSIAVVSGTTYTFSISFKHDTPGVPFGLVSNVGNLALNANLVATGEWQEHIVTATATGTGTANFLVVPNNSGQVTTDGCDISMPQAEIGASRAGFIPNTTGAAITLPDATTPYDIIGEYEVLADPIGPFRFRCDTMAIEKGKTATITLTAESRLADWDRARIRRWTSEDQEAEFPGDKFFQFVPELQEKEIIFALSLFACNLVALIHHVSSIGVI